MNNIKEKATRRGEETDLQRLKALQQLNKSIATGHLIRQAMRCEYALVRDWSVPKIKNRSLAMKNPSKHSSTVAIKEALTRWIRKVYDPTMFLTIQLPDSLKTENADKATEHLRRVMAHFERQLLGREWNKYHLPFICFMERGISGLWHYHILFNQGKFKPWHLWLALDNTLKHFNWPEYCLDLDVIRKNQKRVISYCLKELKVNEYGHFESSQFILSCELFGLDGTFGMGHI